MELRFLVLLLIIPVKLNAQECNYYFNLSAGTTLTYQVYNEKGKPDGKIEYVVSKLIETDNGLKTTIQTKIFDKKDELSFSSEYEMLCKENTMFVDIKSAISPQMMGSYEGMDIKIEGDFISFPETLTVGETLQDGKLKMSVSSSGIPIIKLSMKMHDRKVESKEELTLPAGTYEAYKILTKTTTTTFFDIVTSSIEWYCPEIGMVRSESYNKSGKLMSYTELVSVK